MLLNQPLSAPRLTNKPSLVRNIPTQDVGPNEDIVSLFFADTLFRCYGGRLRVSSSGASAGQNNNNRLYDRYEGGGGYGVIYGHLRVAEADGWKTGSGMMESQFRCTWAFTMALTRLMKLIRIIRTFRSVKRGFVACWQITVWKSGIGVIRDFFFNFQG